MYIYRIPSNASNSLPPPPRVPCSFTGDMRLIVSGSPYWMNVLFENVAGPGDIARVEVAPSGGLSFVPMTRGWGVVSALPSAAVLLM